MAGTYTPIVTIEGQSKIASSIASGPAVNISHLAVGDGNGFAVSVIETMIGLVRETDRVTVTSAARDNADPTKVIVTATIPVASGPYTIREIGVFTVDGKLFAVGAYPETFKPTAAQGATVAVDVQFVIQVSETAQVTITVDPANLVSLAGMARAPFIAVDAHLLNNPPASPAVGDTYTVGAAPTGAWIGCANRFAQWNGSIWAIAVAAERTVVGDRVSGAYYRRTPTGWAPFLGATDGQAGLLAVATEAEHIAGAIDTKAASPKGVARAIQAGAWLYGIDNSATPNTVTPVFVPPLNAYTEGQVLLVKLANGNTAAVTIDAGKGPKNLTRRDGSALQPGDLLGGAAMPIEYDGGKFRLATIGYAEIPRNTPVGTNPVIWVRTDGNDNNDGTANDSAHALATINGAIIKGGQIFNMSGKTLDIRLGNPGTYAPIQVSQAVNFSVTGDNANHTNYIIAGGGPAYITACAATLSGVTLRNTDVNFAHVLCSGGGQVVFAGTCRLEGVGTIYALLDATTGGNITCTGTLNVAGNGQAFAYATGSGSIYFSNGAVTNFVGSPAFSGALFNSSGCSSVVMNLGGPFPRHTFTGTPSGVRYSASLNGIISTANSGPSGLPGTGAGSVTTGGQYE